MYLRSALVIVNFFERTSAWLGLVPVLLNIPIAIIFIRGSLGFGEPHWWGWVLLIAVGLYEWYIVSVMGLAVCAAYREESLEDWIKPREG